MSRTRKRPNPRKRTYAFGVCPRHGYCSWCDRDRQHNKIKTDSASRQDLKDAGELIHWQDYYE